MINKLFTFFPNSVTQPFPPDPFSTNYHWFQHLEDNESWIGIPKADVSESQLELLKTLMNYSALEANTQLAGSAKSWHQFLFENGPIPNSNHSFVRFIQFKVHSTEEIDRTEVTEALRGFLPDHILIWQNEATGVLIEEGRSVSETREELESISSTFESDFFLKISFYLGKFQSISNQLPVFFEHERKVFLQANHVTTRFKVADFEKVFPLLIAANLPANVSGILEAAVIGSFADDKESLLTVKVFLESGSNASLAAKRLYIHRNTLQYRLDKFMEKTGINLKDFDSAAMVYIACLYEEMR